MATTATGGRSGRSALDDGSFAVDMVRPDAAATGDKTGVNPEQLFAVGYAACFHSALQAVARAGKVDVADSAVGSRVHIGPKDGGGYQLAVELEVTLPHLDTEAAQQLADQAHEVCPYSNATRGNIDVTVTVTQD